MRAFDIIWDCCLSVPELKHKSIACCQAMTNSLSFYLLLDFLSSDYGCTLHTHTHMETMNWMCMWNIATTAFDTVNQTKYNRKWTEQQWEKPFYRIFVQFFFSPVFSQIHVLPHDTYVFLCFKIYISFIFPFSRFFIVLACVEILIRRFDRDHAAMNGCIVPIIKMKTRFK